MWEESRAGRFDAWSCDADLGGERMNKKVFIVGMVLLLAISGIIASNMGFKLNYRLEGAAAPGSNSGTNTLGLPYNRQTGLLTANNLITDMGLANVANMQDFVEATDSFNIYTGRKGTPSPDFNLEAGKAIFVKMNAGIDYIVVGSHDPSMAISLDASGAGSNSGTNFFSVPYHTTAATANDMITDLGLANVANMQDFVEATDSFNIYTGRKGTPSPDFAIVPGAGYFIKMNATVNYVPAHY
jgi:hypothetical protein